MTGALPDNPRALAGGEFGGPLIVLSRPAMAAGLAAATYLTSFALSATSGEGVGACCLPDGGCLETFESECIAAEGVFQGQGVPCSPGLCSSGCLGDLDGDGVVGIKDLLRLLADFGPPLECPPYIAADIDQDCMVGRHDLTILLEAWGSCGTRGGACCLPDSSCLDLPQLECAKLEGQYLGDFTSCDTFGCLPSSIIFSAPNEFSAQGEPVREARGDFDGDGFDDIVAIIPAGPGAPGSAQLFFNQGVGKGEWLGLEPGPSLMTGIEPQGAAVALINEDSAPDIVVSNEGDNTLSLFVNEGKGTFAPAIVLAFDSLDRPRDVAAADFTGDGLIDLAVANAGNDTVVLLEGSAGASAGTDFGERQIIPVAAEPGVLDPEDLDADKDIDIVVGGESGDQVSVLYSSASAGLLVGDDVFLPAINLPVGEEPVDIALADLDGNGLPDILSANRADSTVSIIFVNGFNDFDLTFPRVPVGQGPVAVETGDFDADGDPDLVVIADDPLIGPAVQAIENRVGDAGFVSFALPVGFPVDGNPNWVTALDANMDEVMDVATVNSDDGPTGGSVTVLLAVLAECIADLNGDGFVGFYDLLLLVASFGQCPLPGECPADLNGDGTVNQGDLLILLDAWGPCPGSAGG